MSSSGRGRPKTQVDPCVFPFDHGVFVDFMLKECYWLRQWTGSYAVLHQILHDSQHLLQVSQCSLQKALERACSTCKQAFGASVHDKFWKVAKFLSNNPHRTFEVRKPHIYAPCMAGELTVAHDGTYSVSEERWLSSWRNPVSMAPEYEEQWRVMNFQLLESIVQHQLEHAVAWKNVPDHHPIFMALTFSRRGSKDDQRFSATMASHYATMAVRYEVDESRTGSAAFKGLRRWRNIASEDVMALTLTCIWGHKETPRHHQLWHLERLTNERGLHNMVSTIVEVKFLLLIAVLNDHVFAHLPPEDAADAALAFLLPSTTRTPKQHSDITRIWEALKRPRSPYMHILFPETSKVPLESWWEKLRLTPRS